MSSWIFQGNPDDFKIDDYLRECPDFTWEIRQKRFKDKIQVGDEVFIWRSAGKKKKESGIVAVATVTREPVLEEEHDCARQFYQNETIPKAGIRARLRVKQVPTSNQVIISSQELQKDPLLKELEVMRMPRGTNYELSTEEADRLRGVIRSAGR